MTPYDPPKPAGRNPAAHSGFLRNTGRSNSPGVSPCLSRIVRKQTRCALSSARPALACTASNVSHHHPQTANLCTAHQSASLCLACVYWGRDETPRRESRRAHFLIIPNYKSAKWTHRGPFRRKAAPEHRLFYKVHGPCTTPSLHRRMRPITQVTYFMSHPPPWSAHPSQGAMHTPPTSTVRACSPLFAPRLTHHLPSPPALEAHRPPASLEAHVLVGPRARYRCASSTSCSRSASSR